MSDPVRIVIGAGGTGGHIYPGLATAAALVESAPGAIVTFVGTPRGLEQRLIPQAGFELDLVDMVPWRGAARAVQFAVATVRATAQARRVLVRRRPDVVIGMGGYPSLPVVLAGRLMRAPVVLHESGAVAGRANVLAARTTSNIALAFDSARPSFPRHDPRVVGMPLDDEIAHFDRSALRASAREEYGVPDGVRLVLVNGGSQGSARLNELAIGLGRRWAGRDDVRIVLKAGAAHIGAVEAELAGSPAATVVRAVRYLDRMVTAYAAADLAVCRAGAGTVAELATCGLPAVLVPYPFAPDDHQTANARVLADAGAAVLVPDGEATADVAGPRIEELLSGERLDAMAGAARGESHAEAARALAAWALELRQ